MKRMKKLFALLMTLAMVMGLGITGFAEVTPPKATDTKEVMVQNVEAGATVKAYQIVKANYDTNGFTGYESVSGVDLTDETAPTSNEVVSIASKIQADELSSLNSVEMTQGTANNGLANYTANLAPGYWIILVTGTNNLEVYNPMLIGVYYSVSGSDNTMTSQPVDANSNWTLVTEDAYAKSTKPVIKKTIGDNQNAVAIGDDVNFRIETAIPSYSKLYDEVVVKISDSLSEGLTLEENSIEILVGDKTYAPDLAVSAGETGLYVNEGDDGFILTFPSVYALENSGKSVVITYKAKLNNKAGINFDANTNTATLEYTNNPSNKDDTKRTDDKTYTYTFGIDALLNGEHDQYNQTTSEIVKVDEEGKIISTVTEISEEPEEGITEVLTGATFTLTNNVTDKVYTATTDQYGKLNFEGLDEGTYTLVETVAPTGFTLDATPHTVVIEANYNSDGLLTDYTIKIDNKATSTYIATYEGETITNIDSDTVTTQIRNAKLTALPSTGGMGTTLFTIAGCVIMISAAGLFFATRKKAN